MRSFPSTWWLGVLVLGLWLVGCGSPSGTCSPSNCTGCCDASGACQAGNSNLACGVTGGACSVCQGAQSCTLGVCAGVTGSGGGTGTGGGTSTGGGTGTGGGTTTGGGTGGGSSSGGGTGGGAAPTNGTDYCLASVDAQIAFNQRCGTYSPAGLADARTRAEAECRSGAFLPGLGDGRYRYDATAGAACLNLYRQASCTVSAPVGYEVCADVFVGTVGLNGTCFNSYDCTSDLYCDISATCPGQCRQRKAVGQPVTSGQECVLTAEAYGGVCTALTPLGQSCAPTGGVTQRHRCTEGNVCSPSDVCVAYTPAVLQAAGQTCNTTDLECGTGLTCVAGTCAPLGTVGAACDSVRRCQYDLDCGPANTCIAPLPAGATCTGSDECGRGLFCNKASGATTGSCAPLRTLDQTCTGYGQCAGDLFCTGTTTSPGVCKQPGTIGQGCTYTGPANQCVPDAYCTATSTATSGVCAAKKITGASCTGFSECQGSCSNGVCQPPTYCYDATP